MKKIKTKILALILCVTMLMGCIVPAGAAAETGLDGTLILGHVIDLALDTVLDVLINVLLDAIFSADSLSFINPSTEFPTVDEYFAENHEYFYEGTDGEVKGSGWKLGYSSEGIIPEKWRYDADGNKAADGMRLKGGIHFFGGYFGSTVKDIYDDERVYFTVLSAGADANKNGIEDVIIIGAVDNIGISNGNIRDMRKAASDALIAKGLAADDIVACEINCTHAHTVIEGLGMSITQILFKGLGNHFLFRKDRAIEKALYDTICEKTTKAVGDAYSKLESGTLYYYETENVNDYMKAHSGREGEVGDTIRDKLQYGAGCQQFFACWYFEALSGTKTILANIGLHPTFSGRNSKRVCADVPYYMWKTMQDAGYQFQFIQGSQAAIGLSGNYTKEGAEYAAANALTYEDWVARYGQKYADENFAGNDDDDGEAQYFNVRATGYSLAHFIIDSIDRSNKVTPVYNIKMGEIIIPLDYSIIYLAANAALFGYNTVQYDGAETGYGIVTEIGFVQLGDDVVMLTLPGEISPAITFGKDERYTGEASWEGDASWNMADWEYKTLAEYAKDALGQDKTVIAMGICNDELGYLMPDSDTARSFLTKSILGSMGDIYDRANNEELMAASRYAGSALAQGFKDFFEDVK